MELPKPTNKTRLKVEPSPQPWDDFPYRRLPGKEQLIMSENQSFLQELEGRSQKLTSAPDDKIVIDRETLGELLALVSQCALDLVNPRDNEIFLTSLDIHLSKSDSPEARKSLLLLNHYRDVAPEALGDIAEWLEEARQLINVVLAASEMGAS